MRGSSILHELPNTAADSAECYCRRCGYDLRASDGRCPECGQAFDPAERRTFSRVPPPSALWRWARRALVAMAVVALGIGGVLLWLWRGWKAEQTHIAVLASHCESVKVEPLHPRLRERLPHAVGRLLDRVTELRVASEHIDGAMLQHVAEFSHLSSLSLHSYTIADKSLGRLQHLRRLRSLYCNAMTDAGLANLESMSQMERLVLWRARITDAGLIHLRKMTRLRYLDLSETSITGTGLANLRGMTQLEYLGLNRSPISDAGVAHLKGMVSLRTLDLAETRITDAGLTYLTGLSNLEVLHLQSNGRLTDEGLKNLSSLRNLRWLYIPGLQGITPEGVESLQKALPMTEIHAQWE